MTKCSLSLTTTDPDDIIIVGCNCFPSAAAFSVSDTAGLTFTPRGSQLNIGGNQFVQTWYAIASSTLSSDTISVTTALTGETWYGIVAFAISGANLADPFVSGFPIAQANSGCSSPCNTGVSAPAGAFVFQVGGDTGSTVQTAGPSATLIRASSSGLNIYAQYEIPSSPLASATLSFGAAQGSDFGVIVDAINPAPATTSSSSASQTSTSSSASSPIPMTLDGSASTGCGYVTKCSVSLTTSEPDDLIVVGCDCLPAGTTFSASDTAGLTFTPMESQLSIGGGQFLETWYAIASSPLSSDTISVTTSDTGETWYGMVAFAVSGADTVDPFVSGFPLAQANLDCNSPCNTGVSAPAGSFVFQVGGDTGNTLQTAGAGMTLIQATKSGGDVYAQYTVTTSALSGATLSFGTTQSDDFGVIAVAIAPTTGSSTSSSSSSTSSSSTSTSSSSSSSSPLALDGYNVAVLTETGQQSITLTATTSQANDVVVLFPQATMAGPGIPCSSMPGPAVVESVTDADGLVWHQRSAGGTPECEVSPGPAYDGWTFLLHGEEWYAIASKPLSSDEITVTFSAPDPALLWQMLVVEFGVSGANTGAPFDTNPSVPCVSTGWSTVPSCTLSTTGSRAMVIAASISLNGVEPATGYTAVLPSGSYYYFASPEYEVFNSPQTNIMPSFTQLGDIANGDDTWLVIADAIG